MLGPKNIEEFLENYIKKDMVIALGTSKTAHKVIGELALKNVLNDLNVTIVPTSLDIANIASEYKIKVGNIEDNIDLIIEFASIVDPLYNYAKEGTQSLIRDKLIAYHAKEVIVFIEDFNIQKQILKFPVEISKYGHKKTLAALESFGKATLRKEKNGLVKTLGQNYLIDLELNKTFSYDDLEFKVKEIPGVLETGLFINLADKIYKVGKKEIEKIVDFTKVISKNAE